MPICRERKIAFIHVPKTAGMTLLYYFKFKRDVKNFYGNFCNYNVSLTHLTLNQLNDLIGLKDFYKFAFIRNPWDRMVSKFNFDLQKFPDGPKPFPVTNNFEKFILDLKKNFNTIIDNKPNHWLCCHFPPQSSFVLSKEIKLDFLGVYENFQNDVKFLADKFEIKEELPHRNKTDHKDFKKYYTNKTRDIVGELYKEDIKNFGYTFDKKIYSFKSLV